MSIDILNSYIVDNHNTMRGEFLPRVTQGAEKLRESAKTIEFHGRDVSDNLIISFPRLCALSLGLRRKKPWDLLLLSHGKDASSTSRSALWFSISF